MANKLREFENAHRVWMNTSVFTGAGERARAEKDRAMKEYSAAYETYRTESEAS